MDKLIGKIKRVLVLRNNGLNSDLETIEKLEQITDDFAVAFAIFLRQKCLIDDNYLYYFFNGKKYNETELLQHFKQNIYGK